MISVQELLKQRPRSVTNQAVPTEQAAEYPNRPSAEDSAPTPNIAAETAAETAAAESIATETRPEDVAPESDTASDTESEGNWVKSAARPLPSRGRVRQRQYLGLTCLLAGYLCLGWALQDFGTAPLIWLLVWAGAALWGLDRARQWHVLLPALVSALALISMVLPVWVLGLLSIPILGFFGCVLLMKEQSLESALMSSLFVYSLSVVGASIGAIGLSLMGGDAPAIAFGVFRVVISYAFLSLVPILHRRRFHGLRALKPRWRALAVKYGQFAGISLAGLMAGVGLSRVDWNIVFDFTSQWLN